MSIVFLYSTYPCNAISDRIHFGYILKKKALFRRDWKSKGKYAFNR